MWFTYDVDSVAKIGDLKIELDSEVVVQHDLQDLVNGGLGEPFVWPFVGNTNDTNGGNVIRVPMPYAKSMRVSTANNPHFYHVTYREFPSSLEVSTFDPDDSASDVLHNTRTSFGVRDPKCLGDTAGCPYSLMKTHRETQAFSVPPNQAARNIVTVAGSGVVTQLQLRVPGILGATHVKDDGRAYGVNGGSVMTFQLDPGYEECQLTRRLDLSIGHQRASVTVDMSDAGEWPDSGDSVNATWADQTLPLDPKLTTGKSKITVQNEFLSSEVDVNEFYYALHCRLNETDDWTVMDFLNVGPNNVHDEAAHGYQITVPTWEGLRHYQYGGERFEKADSSLDLIANIHLRITFDNHETVHAPIGSFFGSPLGKFDSRSLMFSIDTFVENGAFTSWWPMPFKKEMSVELTNSAGEAVEGSINLLWAEWEDGSPRADWGYFSTQYQRADTANGELWNFLSTPGQGIAYGVTHGFRGAILPPANTLEFLEGDEKVWANQGGNVGSFDNATMLGTGTEDFYESGWYFEDAQNPGSAPVPFAMPFTGMTAHEHQELDCTGDCLSAYRIMLTDSMSFSDGISFNIEHGPVHNNVSANYETTAFFYRSLD
ncbi:hypothetical protein BDV59DRAFT_200434 [Aspergillus ambiguus]|uniref:glycoside hydrolase family 172 protein n=1 Tax=Aspergillus ambiguus TaxID=176160 RepID=UPI003CCE4CDD